MVLDEEGSEEEMGGKESKRRAYQISIAKNTTIQLNARFLMEK